jgi:hypothetical protein
VSNLDTKRLREFARSLRRVTDTATMQRIAERVAPDLTDAAQASFAARETPYGDAWRPGADGNDVTLERSGALRSGLKFVAIGTRVRCVLGARHAKYQVGKRQVLPSGVLPESWQDHIRTVAHDEIAKTLAGGT